MSAAEAMDTTKNDVKAPLGMQLGIYAAGVHWVSALVLIIGIVTSDGDHSDEWSAKYPEFSDRLAVMYDFNHTDSANLLQDRFTMMYQVQFFLVLEGLMESFACLLAICMLMCVKAQLNYNSNADERELCTYACLLLGLLIPMLEFCMRAGPVSFVGWVAHEDGKWRDNADPDAFFKNFDDTHIQMLALIEQTVEALFNWLNVFADLLLGLGFIQLSFIGSARADIIFDNNTRLVGFWTGIMFWVTFFVGCAREVTWGGDHVLYLYMEITGRALSAMIGIFLMPTFFVMVAIGLGRVDSIEALNGDLTDAVNAAARAAATERLKARNVEDAMEQASNPAASDLTVADDADES